MKAGFALLTDRTVENTVNRLAWDVHLRWQTGVAARCYPAHISLKQPFEIGDRLAEMEGYMAQFAASIPPLPIELRGLFVWETVLGIDVGETPALRELHNRLNRELPPIFGDVRADHDGDEYHFHITVAMGGARCGHRTGSSTLPAPAWSLPKSFTATPTGALHRLRTTDWWLAVHAAYSAAADRKLCWAADP